MPVIVANCGFEGPVDPLLLDDLPFSTNWNPNSFILFTRPSM